MKKGLRTTLVLLALLLLTTIANAADVPEYVLKQCREKAKQMNLVNINYHFGKLILDNTKTTEEVTKSCSSEEAVGCFAPGARTLTFSMIYEDFKMESYFCAVPIVDISIDWVDANVYITKEKDSCTRRAILRHELQHFMIWKTAADNMLQELKNTLSELLLQNGQPVVWKTFLQKQPELDEKMEKTISDIVNKWDAIKRKNNELLDEIDHNMDTEVAYRGCHPYSVKSQRR